MPMMYVPARSSFAILFGKSQHQAVLKPAGEIVGIRHRVLYNIWIPCGQLDAARQRAANPGKNCDVFGV